MVNNIINGLNFNRPNVIVTEIELFGSFYDRKLQKLTEIEFLKD